jgi:hypothetical protein
MFTYRNATQLLLAVISMPCALLAGCGGELLPLVPVSGVVTFDGGECPGPGNVTFQPLEVAAGLPNRPASGKFDRDGRYSVTSFQPGDGLLPGRYQVAVTCYSGLPNPKSRDPFGDVNHVPEDFRPDDLVVEAGSSPVQLDLNVPPKKLR